MKLQPHEKAARVIRLMGWLGVLSAIAMGTAVVVPAVAAGHALPIEFAPIGAVILAIPVSLLFIAHGLFAERPWARVAAKAYSVVALFGAPIGTIAGFYVLWQLQKAKQSQPNASVRAPTVRQEPSL